MPDRLTQRDGEVLLGLARAAIVDALEGGASVEATLSRAVLAPAMEVPRGAFVTLRSPAPGKPPGTLRGCIGTIVSERPLYRNVIETAPRSALEDPRFDPLQSGDVAALTIEVSALTPLRPVGTFEEIVVGRDGVQLSRDGRRAVFLPQVATEQGWDAVRLLEQLALKAGLPRDAWRDAELDVFQAEVFADAGPAAG